MKKITFILIVTLAYFNAYPLYAQSTNASHISKVKDVHISFKIPHPRITDTFTLYKYKNILSEQTIQYLPYTTQYAVLAKDSMFHFTIHDINHPEYITVGKDKDSLSPTKDLIPILDLYMIAPGDNLTVNIVWDSAYHANEHLIPWILSDNKIHMVPEIVGSPTDKYLLQYKIEFSGSGAAKYKCRRQLDIMQYMHPFKIDSILSVIAGYKSRMNRLPYQVLQADAIGFYEKFIYPDLFKKNSNSLKKSADNYFDTVSNDPEISQEAKTLSRYFPKALLLREYFKYSRNHYQTVYSHIKKRYKNELRDKLITIYAMENVIPDSTGILMNAMNTVSSPFCLKQLSRIYKGQAVGMQAYNFALPDTTGKLIKLSDFRGKVIFIDFWFTGCYACAGFYQNELSKIEDKYKTNRDVIFLTISIDGSRSTWIQSIYSKKYTTPAAVNLYTGGRWDKDPVISYYHIIGYPSPFIIDKKGRIYYAVRIDRDYIKKLEAIIHNALSVK